MKKLKTIIILINLVVLLILFNKSVIKKEILLSDGSDVFLELKPVDPRSLMQGDYMILRYTILNDIKTNEVEKRGFCTITIEDNGVASSAKIYDNKTPLKNNEQLVKYFLKEYRGVNIGAESYFFQEGEGKKYENAKYSSIKIDKDGNSLLVGLYDQNFNKIE